MSNDAVISADSHVQEPDELYREWLPKDYRHLAPRTEEIDGALYRIVDGKRPRRLDVAKERDARARKIKTVNSATIPPAAAISTGAWRIRPGTGSSPK